MQSEQLKKTYLRATIELLKQAWDWMLLRPWSVILLAALIYNLVYKFLWAYRLDLISQYYKWIGADLTFLLGVEVIFALICSRWPTKRTIRLISFISALICTWSVMNAGWLYRNGHQLLPSNLLPLFRDPANSFGIVGGNFKAMPIAATLLLVPAALLIVFFLHAMIRPRLMNYNRRRFALRIKISLVAVIIAAALYAVTGSKKVQNPTAAELKHNCHLTAALSLLKLTRTSYEISEQQPSRLIPHLDQIDANCAPVWRGWRYNIVIVVLEGVQYRLTSLADRQRDLTPALYRLSQQGAFFPDARSILTHTTKALFSLLTGFNPSPSQDIAEAVPVDKPYMSLVTILKEQLNYRSAFFQSAKGNFESRPGLVHNLGFEKFFSRDELDDPNTFVGYLGADEFAMLEPISEWIQSDDSPFLLTVLCSVTHDPYEVPRWFGEPEKELFDRYIQTIRYTDGFIAALDAELAGLNLADKTILCVVGDHGEAFGEHGKFGHERVVFDEALRIPFVIRAPSLIQPATVIPGPVSSIDLTPTLLGLFGFNTAKMGFDGQDVLRTDLAGRKLYFAGWLEQSPAGLIQHNKKFLYDPTYNLVFCYDLQQDPQELSPIPLNQEEFNEIEHEVSKWRQQSIFKINQTQKGRKILYDRWLCRWEDRIATAKYLLKDEK